MNCNKLFAPAFVAAVGLAVVVGSIAIADSSKETSAATEPELKLPPGWTAEDMQACILAGTPGEMHQRRVARHDHDVDGPRRRTDGK